ncbi:uncharacterized protein BDR25DRAFT_302040 [Lindgomyces ingoldianus]|uniref:Uncharacterized protein n=1 Tax=Lindgomyces ingoldianus TaxID=673940 RepID=A0ACB6R6A9_9PLEO|nr:uncharacterized protein BDR25DRAFT_302040 [Lindgomyces ingoldianus]KAF2473991.1 hypothetical protein BDR25DRAFT_302040 [Lindgomyces ingoldianus]
MRPLLQHASRSIFASPIFTAPPRASKTLFRSLASAKFTGPAIYLPCIPPRKGLDKPTRRQFSHSRTVFEKPTRPLEADSAETKTPLQHCTPQSAKLASPPKDEDTIARVPAEHLPSHREGQRWNLSRRFSELMDDLLPKLALVTQKVNTYTGTDYSGIEALRREIKEQEQLVKTRHLALNEAKQALDDAHAKQASSQKEVVGLLERKHSWSATDLERYMQLIRSEHVNDQAVQAAKDKVFEVEAALEEARTRLEKRERAQYHEEQIWSDTIRRNSTWVTFGLMGFNIFLLLASLVVIEPWRRRRLVREVKAALEAQRTVFEPAAGPQSSPILEAAVDEAVEPAEKVIGSLVIAEQTTHTAPKVEEDMLVQQAEPNIIAALKEDSMTLTPEKLGAASLATFEPEHQTTITPMPWQEKITTSVRDLMSEKYISIRRKEFTIAIVEATATGAVISGLLLFLIRPN